LVLSVAAGAMSILGASPAMAAPVSVPVLCTTSAFGMTYDPSYSSLAVELVGPTEIPEGVNPTYQVSVPTGPESLPLEIANATLRASATVAMTQVVGGSISQSFAGLGATGPTATIAPYAPLNAPTPIPISVNTGGLIATDQVEFSLESFTVEFVSADGGLAGATTTCTPTGSSSTLLTVPIVTNPSAIDPDRCLAEIDGAPAPQACEAGQSVNLSLEPGFLAQRHYQTSPNPASQVVPLGSLRVPTAPKPMPGVMNDVVVTDTRGGKTGWSLTATSSDFVGTVPSHTIGRANLYATPSCVPATSTTAFDYEASGVTTVAGFDAATVAPGVFAGGANQSLSGAITLCAKDTTVSTLSDSTGGIYVVGAALTLMVPGFISADDYQAVLTVTLA
jgi:hypothetical protein